MTMPHQCRAAIRHAILEGLICAGCAGVSVANLATDAPLAAAWALAALTFAALFVQTLWLEPKS